MNEQEAIYHLKRGEIRGLAVLVERYQIRAIRTAYLITHDTATAEDVVHDTFLQIYRLMMVLTRRAFAPWFYDAL